MNEYLHTVLRMLLLCTMYEEYCDSHIWQFHLPGNGLASFESDK